MSADRHEFPGIGQPGHHAQGDPGPRASAARAACSVSARAPPVSSTSASATAGTIHRGWLYRTARCPSGSVSRRGAATPIQVSRSRVATRRSTALRRSRPGAARPGHGRGPRTSRRPHAGAPGSPATGGCRAGVPRAAAGPPGRAPGRCTGRGWRRRLPGRGASGGGGFVASAAPAGEPALGEHGRQRQARVGVPLLDSDEHVVGEPADRVGAPPPPAAGTAATGGTATRAASREAPSRGVLPPAVPPREPPAWVSPPPAAVRGLRMGAFISAQHPQPSVVVSWRRPRPTAARIRRFPGGWISPSPTGVVAVPTRTAEVAGSAPRPGPRRLAGARGVQAPGLPATASAAPPPAWSGPWAGGGRGRIWRSTAVAGSSSTTGHPRR